MSAVVIAFETPAQKERRLYREVIAACDDFSAAPPRASLAGVVRTMERLVACHGAAQASAGRSRPPTAQGSQGRHDQP